MFNNEDNMVMPVAPDEASRQDFQRLINKLSAM